MRLINLGYNPLTDNVLETIEPALCDNAVLEALGLQSTLITDTGAQHLARGLEENTSLRVIEQQLTFLFTITLFILEVKFKK